MKKAYFIILCIFINYHIYGQDTLNIESTISIETIGSGIWVNGKKDIECVTCLFETIQDNPIHHFAISSGIVHKLSINKTHHIETGIYLEERSFSGGSNTLNNWVVYPKILLTGEDTFQLFNNSFSYKLQGGDFWNQDFNDMLRIHNMDYQGIVAELGYGAYRFGILIAGDLSKNVGLGLHQYHKFYVQRDFKKFETTFSLGENQLTDYDQHIVPRDFNIGNNTRIKLSNKIQLESQLEVRLNQVLGTSFAAGIGIRGQFKNLKFSSNLKYYQSDFNLGYKSSRTSIYRGASSYVGDQLYPLKNYYRSFSQWGNYTRRQNIDLLGFELQLKWEKKLKKNLSFFTDVDLNIIGNLKRLTGNTIPLYTLGLRTNYFEFLKTEFFFTNKHMNLDTFYQTFQASTMPFFGGSVILDLTELRLN